MLPPAEEVTDADEIQRRLLMQNDWVNALFTAWSAAASAPIDEPEDLQPVIRGLNGLYELLRCFPMLDRSCVGEAHRMAEALFGPLLAFVNDRLIREKARRCDGARAKPATYTLTAAMWQGELAAAADVQIMSKGRPQAKTWLNNRLVHFPDITASRIFEWRKEIRQRMAQKRDEAAPFDVVAAVFHKLRPEQSRFPAAEADRRAATWIADARRRRAAAEWGSSPY
jgi:hypothetical protein